MPGAGDVLDVPCVPPSVRRAKSGALRMRFHTDRSGATAIEYALIAGGIALAIIAGLTTIPGGINKSLNKVSATLSAGS